MFTEEMKRSLDAPLNRSNVKSREQAGRKLSYIEGWHAIAEANRIFGFDGWSRETIDIHMVSERERKIGKQLRDGWAVSYTAKVRIVAHGVVREGIGAGHGIDVDLGLAHESAIKESETDAAKRALMTFGNPFGLALYDKSQANVSDEHEEDATDFLRSAEKSLHAAAIMGTDSLVKSWKSLPDNIRQAFGGTCPPRFKDEASKHDKREAA